MNARHFSQNRSGNADGPEDPLHLEPTDLSQVKPEDYHLHEGEPVMLNPELLEFVSSLNSQPSTKACDHIEGVLDDHYRLKGTGYGIAWDIRSQTARLVKL